jgi:hypothetical protein
MTANATAAYGMYPRMAQLPQIVGALNKAGFENQDICMVLSPAHPDAELVRGPGFHDQASDRDLSARMIEWFSKFGAVIIPNVGFFARSQTFLKAVVCEPTTSALSRGSRVLLGLGFSQDDATRLSHQLADFGALIYVSCPGRANAEGAIESLRNSGAREAASVHMMQASAAAA